MAPCVCQTDIKFFGKKEALNDLFSRISKDWLTHMTERFLLDKKTISVLNEFDTNDGYITNVDKCEYTIHQQDIAIPHAYFWDAVIDTNYKPNRDRLIDFVYTSTCPENGIFINTDTEGKYFDFNFAVAYDVLDKKGIVNFKEIDDLYAWCSERFLICANSISIINGYARREIGKLIERKKCTVKMDKEPYCRAVRYTNYFSNPMQKSSREKYSKITR